MPIILDALAGKMPLSDETPDSVVGDGYVIRPFGMEKICEVSSSPRIFVHDNRFGAGFYCKDAFSIEFAFLYPHYENTGIATGTKEEIAKALKKGEFMQVLHAWDTRDIPFFVEQGRACFLKPEQIIILGLTINRGETHLKKCDRHYGLSSEWKTLFYRRAERAELVRKAEEYIHKNTIEERKSSKKVSRIGPEQIRDISSDPVLLAFLDSQIPSQVVYQT